ncbi:MAG: NAD/FAD-dependent oxidoreductase [Halobacteriales archaeon SW_9_67_25]|nr:MAG: NAD/FAD-dependent oxidoreductase [Halobacteriales archaeon SW_9_67_25]
MTHIGFVGAGAATAAAAFVLGDAADATVTVLEKSGGVCGRAATRRRGDVTYDYGANYVKSDDDRVVELLTGILDTGGLVEVTEPIYTFDTDGTVSEGRDADEHKWTYERGLTQIAKRLFARTDATVHRNTRVERLHRADGAWQVTDADGERWGPFDALALNPPAPQTADLLADAEWDAPVRDDLLAAVRDVEYRTIWTAVLGYPFELDRPYYALVNTDKAHEVGWIAREECKRGHVPGGSVLVVQANHGWSVAHYDDPRAENVDRLAGLAADVIGDGRLTDPGWTDHQGWRYALPESGPERGPLAAAREHGLYCLGDWVTGEARLHAALRNGLETGERLADAL